MEQLHDLFKQILKTGITRSKGESHENLSIFGYQMRFNLTKGFPLSTTRKIKFLPIVYETLWLLSGSSNIKFLKERDVHIWDEYADENDNIGPMYGSQWRNWNGEGIDQISDLIQKMKDYPECKNLILSAWNVGKLPTMALLPTQLIVQFYVREMNELTERDDALRRRIDIGEIAQYYLDAGSGHWDEAGVPRYALDCHVYQRGADAYKGTPHNIAQYALLTHLLAYSLKMEPGNLIYSLGDVHIYKNDMRSVKEQLKREPYSLPHLLVNNKIEDIFSFDEKDIILENYKYYPAIKKTSLV